MKNFLHSHFYPTLGFFLLQGIFYFLLLFLFGMYFGGFYIRLFLCLIYLYQITLCSPWPLFRQFIAFLRPYEYFHSTGTIFEEDNPFAEKKNMVAFHPHGILATSLLLNYYRSKHFHDFHFLATRVLFFIPLGGIITRWLGVIEAVDPAHFEALMEKGENIGFLPGGFEEATITNHNQDQVWVKSRKGFIKYGLKHGYNLYPSYSFNENRMFTCFTWFEEIRLFFNRWKTPGVFFCGRYGLLPRRDLHMFTVVGKRISLPKMEKNHKIYLEKLEELYNKYKGKFESSEKLIIK